MQKFFFVIIITLLFSTNTYAGWFDKKIEITKCYDYKKYRSYRHQVKEVGKSVWEWEIDTEKKIAIQTWSSGNTLSDRINILKHTITIQTDKFIVAEISNPTALHKRLNMEEVKFDLSKERVITRMKDSFFTMQCDFD